MTFKKINHAFIMAAGRGTRLRPLTKKIPKGLIKFKQTSLIANGIKKLKKYIDFIHISVGYKGPILAKHLIEEKVSSIINTDKKGNSWWIFNSIFKSFDSPLYVLTCDNVTNIDFKKIEKDYYKKGQPICMIIPTKPIKGLAGDYIFRKKNIIEIDKQHFDKIEIGLKEVYKSGTGKFLNVPGIEICGKSGTAENFTRLEGKKTQLTDHSIFVAYAPKENPKIAIAVLVENGYYGSTWAGRITSLMIEKYLKGYVTLKKTEELVINKSLENEYLKPFSGKPFSINKL